MTIRQIYRILHSSYGPQGWWPLSKGRMQTRYHSDPPKNKKDMQGLSIGFR